MEVEEEEKEKEVKVFQLRLEPELASYAEQTKQLQHELANHQMATTRISPCRIEELLFRVKVEVEVEKEAEEEQD